MSLRLAAAGSNGCGQLGIGSLDDTNIFVPTLSPSSSLSFSPSDVISIATGASHTLLLVTPPACRYNSSLYYTGSNASSFPLGKDTPDSNVFRPFPLDTARILLDNGQGHSLLQNCSTLQDVLLSHNYYIDSIGASWESSFILLKPKSSPSSSALLISDLLFSCGSNDWSELGRSSSTPGLFGLVDFSNVSPSSTIKIKIDNLVTAPRSILAHISFTSSSPSPSSLLLVGWGACRHGQLGITQQQKQKTFPVPSLISLPSDVSSSVQQDPNLQIAPGKDHTTLAFTPNNEEEKNSQFAIISLGSSRKSQLISPTYHHPQDISNITISHTELHLHLFSSWNTTYGIDVETSCVYTWGSNSYGQLGRTISPLPTEESLTSPPLSDPNPRKICIPLSIRNPSRHFAAGSEHAIAISCDKVSDNKNTPSHLYAWGWNEHGNLGTSNNVNQSTPTRIHLPFTECANLISVFAGNGSSWILYESITS